MGVPTPELALHVSSITFYLFHSSFPEGLRGKVISGIVGIGDREGLMWGRGGRALLFGECF